MPKARYAAEQHSDINLLPAVILLLLVLCLYALDVNVMDSVVSLLQPAAPPGFSP